MAVRRLPAETKGSSNSLLCASDYLFTLTCPASQVRFTSCHRFDDLLCCSTSCRDASSSPLNNFNHYTSLPSLWRSTIWDK